MEKPSEKIIERIRRLLAMANDTSSPHEAGIAARRVQKLMEEYNLHNVESILSDLEDDANVGQETVTNFKVAGRSKKAAKECPPWVGRLSIAVARLFDCEVRITSAEPLTGVRGSVALAFYGYKTDLEVCKWTFEYLLNEVRRFNRQASKQYGKGNRELLGDYRLGLVNGILQVIKEAAREKELAKQAVTSTGTSLMVVKHDAIAKKFGEFRYGVARGKRVNATAWEHGVSDGKSVNLSRPLPGSVNRKALN